MKPTHIACLAAIAGATYLASLNAAGWGWLILIAILLA